MDEMVRAEGTGLGLDEGCERVREGIREPVRGAESRFRGELPGDRWTKSESSPLRNAVPSCGAG